ncbi:MAG: cytoskeletal protein CcmA (bactofilin family) [Bradymonadia bacterium]
MALLRKEDVEPVEPPPTLGAVLGPTSRFEGKLTFDGTVRIDGEFVGDIESKGTLLVGETARIEGTVRVNNATVAGAVTGTLIVYETLEIESMGRVSGEIHVSTLITARGAVVDGSIKMPGDTGQTVN